MEKRFYYKNFIRMLYGLFGIFVAVNGYMRYAQGGKAMGAVMFGLGVFALILFYFYTRFPYIKLGENEELFIKSHPLYPQSVIRKDGVITLDKINDYVFFISFKDKEGKKKNIRINLNLIDKNEVSDAEVIIKSFSPLKKAIDEENNL